MRTVFGVILAVSLAVPAFAAGAQEFTFKRIKPPGAGDKRITVQIDPAEQARRLALAATSPWRPLPPTEQEAAKPAAEGGSAPGQKDAAPARYAWFWDAVPTNIGANADRFPLALAALSAGPGGAAVSAPRLQALQTLAETHGTEILKATLDTDVSPALVLAVMGIESGGKVDAVSSAGAVGLMQLIPATAERFGVADSADAKQNIEGGVAYLDWLMKEFDGDPLMVLAAYNAGEGAVRANAGIPPFAETRDYVPKVLAAWRVAQGLCVSPPELVSDPCVFRVNAAGG
ncbi:MAG: lytic transglycosylase domain-containing protein [Pseudomonadota bacterium]